METPDPAPKFARSEGFQKGTLSSGPQKEIQLNAQNLQKILQAGALGRFKQGAKSCPKPKKSPSGPSFYCSSEYPYDISLKKLVSIHTASPTVSLIPTEGDFVAALADALVAPAADPPRSLVSSLLQYVFPLQPLESSASCLSAMKHVVRLTSEGLAPEKVSEGASRPGTPNNPGPAQPLVQLCAERCARFGTSLRFLFACVCAERCDGFYVVERKPDRIFFFGARDGAPFAFVSPPPPFLHTRNAALSAPPRRMASGKSRYAGAAFEGEAQARELVACLARNPTSKHDVPQIISARPFPGGTAHVCEHRVENNVLAVSGYVLPQQIRRAVSALSARGISCDLKLTTIALSAPFPRWLNSRRGQAPDAAPPERLPADTEYVYFLR
eukprot:gnl/Chilomastix_cuspidata/2178.p2 GENE.gnl/Chilomastix_cuspidata/2178~~gnl/Chilomastix_cuspidata/2178.p2  ORF type:complete len:416 (-),score=146.28 gnl/Chilomastix_cuspidata/2178:788-1942(-)